VLIRDMTNRMPQANRQVAGEVLAKLLD